jgi:hypothetical protein
MTTYFKSPDEVTVGDLITRSPRGRKPIEVLKVDGNYISGRYVDSGKTIWEWYNYFQPYENNDQTIMSKEQLFTWTEVNGDIAYGTLLATNSSGLYVIEEKQTGNIVTMSPGQVEEVIPWTFSARNGANEKHFTGSDTVKKGDVLIQTQGATKFWYVTDVNTKNKTATKFNGRRVVTEEI